MVCVICLALVAGLQAMLRTGAGAGAGAGSGAGAEAGEASDSSAAYGAAALGNLAGTAALQAAILRAAPGLLRDLAQLLTLPPPPAIAQAHEGIQRDAQSHDGLQRDAQSQEVLQHSAQSHGALASTTAVGVIERLLEAPGAWAIGGDSGGDGGGGRDGSGGNGGGGGGGDGGGDGNGNGVDSLHGHTVGGVGGGDRDLISFLVDRLLGVLAAADEVGPRTQYPRTSPSSTWTNQGPQESDSGSIDHSGRATIDIHEACQHEISENNRPISS